MRETPEGYCHICGKYGKLSFEHIPPQKALNNNKAIVYTGENAIKRYKGENAKYKNQQQGMGGFTLCDSCNNNTGTWYAPVYNRIAKEIAQSLHKNKKLEHGDVVQFKLNKFPALSFVKQVVTMFCSLLPLSEVKKLGFDKFLLQKESNNIDNSLFDLRMYLTPFNVGQLMVGPTSIVNKTENGFETIIACDLGTYPFGFILNLTPEIKVEYGTSLMNLFDAVYDKEYSMNWPLMYLERTNDIIPIPLLFKPLPKSINDKTTKKN